MPEPEAFAHLVGALGVDESTPVVVYDAGGAVPVGPVGGDDRLDVSSTTAIPMSVTLMVGWRSGPPKGYRFPATPRPRKRGRSQLAW